MSKPWKLIKETLGDYLSNPGLNKTAEKRHKETIPTNIQHKLQKILDSSHISYRDAVIIQLAYGLCDEHAIDLTKRHLGARAVAGKLGKWLKANHINAVADAYQNIGKNSPVLARGNFPEFDGFLEWISSSDRTKEELGILFNYSTSYVAGTARPVLPCPSIDQIKLTFAAVALLFKKLFSKGSQGAYEQFTVAALLHALMAQSGLNSVRVETKSLNASDKSSRAAGDVQILIGNRVVEAYEVTANHWREKLPGATQTIRTHDLSRLNIVARVDQESRGEMLSALSSEPHDVSVSDIDEFSSVVLSALDKKHRVICLKRLYEFLDRYQPDVEKVNSYVKTLKELELIVEE